MLSEYKEYTQNKYAFYMSSYPAKQETNLLNTEEMLFRDW
jgi:hypothetical protein